MAIRMGAIAKTSVPHYAVSFGLLDFLTELLYGNLVERNRLPFFAKAARGLFLIRPPLKKNRSGWDPDD